MEKLTNRLKELYESRTKAERKLVLSLRYDADEKFVNGLLKTLNELRIRICEVKEHLPIETINQIRSELKIITDF